MAFSPIILFLPAAYIFLSVLSLTQFKVRAVCRCSSRAAQTPLRGAPALPGASPAPSCSTPSSHPHMPPVRPLPPCAGCLWLVCSRGAVPQLQPAVAAGAAAAAPAAGLLRGERGRCTLDGWMAEGAAALGYLGGTALHCPPCSPHMRAPAVAWCCARDPAGRGGRLTLGRTPLPSRRPSLGSRPRSHPLPPTSCWWRL